MNETNFNLHVHYQDKDLIFPAQFLRTGYSYKIQVEVNGVIIDFEPDEERNWRALVAEDQEKYGNRTGVELLQAIAGALENLTK